MDFVFWCMDIPLISDLSGPSVSWCHSKYDFCWKSVSGTMFANKILGKICSRKTNYVIPPEQTDGTCNEKTQNEKNTQTWFFWPLQRCFSNLALPTSSSVLITPWLFQLGVLQPGLCNAALPTWPFWCCFSYLGGPGSPGVVQGARKGQGRVQGCSRGPGGGQISPQIPKIPQNPWKTY